MLFCFCIFTISCKPTEHKIDFKNNFFQKQKELVDYERITSDGFNRVRTERPQQLSLKYIKKWPLTQEIALFFHSSTRTSMACQKKRKNFEDSAP